MFNQLDHLRMSPSQIRKNRALILIARLLATALENLLERLLNPLHLHRADALQSEGSSMDRRLVGDSRSHRRCCDFIRRWRIVLFDC